MDDGAEALAAQICGCATASQRKADIAAIRTRDARIRAETEAQIVAWFRSPVWQSRHPEDAAIARLIGQMIENGEYRKDQTNG